MSDIAEYWAKQKLWSRKIIWKVVSIISFTTWSKGYCRTRELFRVAVRILNIPIIVASCEHNWLVGCWFLKADCLTKDLGT